MKKMKAELGILGRAGIVLFILFGPYYFNYYIIYYFITNKARELDGVLSWFSGLAGLAISIAIIAVMYHVIKWIINGD